MRRDFLRRRIVIIATSSVTIVQTRGPLLNANDLMQRFQDEDGKQKGHSLRFLGSLNLKPQPTLQIAQKFTSFSPSTSQEGNVLQSHECYRHSA